MCYRVGITLDQGMVGPVKLFEFSAEEAISKTCVCQKMTRVLAKLEPWTAVSAYLGLISKVQSSAGARGLLHTYNKVNSSSLVGQVYQ